MTKETYLKSIDILLDAYNNETLFHGSCYKCAVGNLLGTNVWTWDFATVGNGVQTNTLSNFIIEQILDTKIEETPTVEQTIIIRNYLDNLYTEHGFTQAELARIEFAFENSIYKTTEGYFHYSMNDKKKGQFIGLTAVLKVMSEMVEEEVPSQQYRLETIAREKYSVII